MKNKDGITLVALVLAIVNPNAFGACFTGTLSGFSFWYNLIVTILMIISVVATIFSGVDYILKGKDLFKEEVKENGNK